MAESNTNIDMQKVDSWGVGMVLLELLFGYRSLVDITSQYHNKEKCTAAISKVLNSYKTMRLYPSHNDTLITLIRSLLVFNPSQRWTVADALEHFNSNIVKQNNDLFNQPVAIDYIPPAQNKIPSDTPEQHTHPRQEPSRDSLGNTGRALALLATVAVLLMRERNKRIYQPRPFTRKRF